MLLFLLDESLEGRWHSLIANLSSVKPEDWRWVVPGGKRSIFEIVRHVGGATYVYASQAFGDGSIHWDSLPELADDATPEEAIEYLRDGHRRLKASVEALSDDSELMKPRRAHWGQQQETRWLINVMIQHDLYHAGEINYIRALRQGDDE